MIRRAFLLSVSTLLLLAQQAEPWKSLDLMQPEALANILRGPGPKPTILFVGFPVLYKSTRIPGAIMTGPGARSMGIDLMKQAVAKLPKNADIVMYCGCCPIGQCPNVRPAFQALKEMGYTKVRLVMMNTNMHTDWVSKGYPTEKAAGTSGS
jgi:thiosulfate/3-mercaptopyruvate sulfurtransferase